MSTRASRRSGGAAADATPHPADPLVVRSLEFLGGLAERNGWRPESTLPEIAFAGRSNVGKSSLLNALVRRRALARVSRTPGRTREINFFRVNDAFVLVDLPGYGYARVSKTRRETWRPLLEDYLRASAELRGIVLLLDARRDPSDDDRGMLDALADMEIPTVVAITKVDKYGARAGAERVAALTAELGLDDDQVIAVSAHTGAGRDELAEAVVRLLAEPPRKAR